MPPARVPPAARVLVDHLGDGAALPGPLADLEDWLAGSSRLRAFVDANRDKIRKKVRLATTDDTRLDLWAELRVATRLLADRRIELAFEAYGSGNRGPDFTATYRAGRELNLEVTQAPWARGGRPGADDPRQAAPAAAESGERPRRRGGCRRRRPAGPGAGAPRAADPRRPPR